MNFKNESEAIEWIRLNMPIAIKPIKKAKTTYISPFTSQNAFKIVSEHLGKKLYNNK